MRVGTDDANVQTRPFIPSFTPDGKFIIVPNFRTNNVSIVDLSRALAHRPGRGGGAHTADAARGRGQRHSSRAAQGIGGHVRRPLCGDLRRPADDVRAEWHGLDHRPAIESVAATVTGVGNDPYGLAVVERGD